MEQPQQHIDCLPVDLLLRIIGEVPFLERHRCLPLVCRNWRKLVVSRRLLQRISFDTKVGGVVAAPDRLLLRARSFCSWLVAHAAGAVEQLEMQIGTPYRDDTDHAAFFPEIVCALAACGSSLRHVTLYLQFLHDLRFPAALATALSQVSRLRLEVEEGAFSLEVPLAGSMQRLEDLHLRAFPGMDAYRALEIAPSAILPASLTRLSIAGLGWEQEEEEKLPPQLASLTRLRDLTLDVVQHAPEGYAVLTQLGRCLERLRLKYCSWLPSTDTFAALTRLTLLSVDTVGEQREAFEDFPGAMEATLEVLPQLQHLRCSYASSGYVVDVPCLPRALSRLQRLQRFWWDMPTTDDASLPDPHGQWLHGLHSLALYSNIIVANQERLLAATPHLENLFILHGPGQLFSLPRPALRVAVQHPALHHTHVPVRKFARDEASAKSAVEWAQQQRPDALFTYIDTTLFDLGATFDDESS